MAILTINAGSSSLRFMLFDEKLKPLYKGHVDAIGQRHCHFRKYLKNGSEEKTSFKAKNHEDALRFALQKILNDGAIKNLQNIQKVGHRVVHGGEDFTKTTLLTEKVLKKLHRLSPLAPLHNPVNLLSIQACRRLLKKAKHYAIFDTAFHSTLPEQAFLYGLPYSLYKKEGIRRYGFHGTSHKVVAKEAAKLLKKPSAALITCHLGNGVSLAAIKNGICLDTSMGFTPLEGPLMGTRSGSIDPAIIFHLAQKRSLPKIQEILQHESGFKGLSGIGSDVRSLWAKANSPGTRRTFNVFSYQMAKWILSFTAALKGQPDALVFTAGIGENAFYLRKQICDHLKILGIQLDLVQNRKNATVISKKTSKVKVLVIPTQEEWQMAREIL